MIQMLYSSSVLDVVICTLCCMHHEYFYLVLYYSILCVVSSALRCVHREYFYSVLCVVSSALCCIRCQHLMLSSVLTLCCIYHQQFVFPDLYVRGTSHAVRRKQTDSRHRSREHRSKFCVVSVFIRLDIIFYYEYILVILHSRIVLKLIAVIFNMRFRF